MASAPNLGVLLKSQDEWPTHGKVLGYATGDEAATALRPKLTVTYTDPSASDGPTVAVNAPAPGETVRGTVPVTATAADDGRVDRVQFFVDGAAVGTDTTAPYSLDWSSTGVANGSRTITAKATDDVGNVTTSAGVSVDVANSAPPSTRVLSPSGVYEDLVKADAPSAWWRLGETAGTAATDASGNGRGGAIAGTHALGQPGLLVANTDKALKLANGTTDGKVTVSSMSGLLGTRLAAEAWVDYAGVSTLNGENRVISRNWGASGGWMLALVKDGAGIQRARWAIDAAGTVVTASAPVTPGKLHLAGTYDGATLRLYVNGAEVASTPSSSAALNSSAAVYLGEALDVDQTLDEAALYERALTAEQVKRHFDVGAGTDPSVTGETTVEAAASDDGSISKVEFYVDGTRFGEDSAAPYQASLKTLDAAEPTYDGAHVLSTKAYDNHGQVTSSADAKVKVVNAAASKFLAGYESTELPQAMTYDPAAGTGQDKAGVDVTVTNASPVTWSATDVVLRYRWVSPDPADPAPSMTASGDIPLGSSVGPGGSAVVRALVEPPVLPEGVEAAQYQLRFDLFEKSTSTWFAAKGNKPHEKPVTVRKALQMALGLEHYYHYDGEELGAGMQHLVNVASGNSLVRWSPWEAPGRGLSTVLDLTYNSLEKKCECPAGNNVSLSISGLTRFGNPLDVHPNKADEIAGRANRFVEFTDGDGTTHRFTGREAADQSVYWEAPPGVHLYLRSLGTADPARRWALTRPDRVTFYYDAEGYPTSIEDGNGNRITFVLEDVPPAADPGGPKRRVTAVRDAGGRSFTVDYYSKADAKKPQVRGKVKRITDHSGSALDFDYYEDGNLLRLIQRGGTSADGAFLADRTFVFTYTTSNGEGPALSAGERVSPNPKTSNQSTRLFSVRDPRGKETTFSYLGTGSGQDRWKLASRTDRSDARTDFSYDNASRTTTVTRPLSRVSKISYDVEGKVTRVTDPLDRDTSIVWNGDRMVEKVTEPGGRYTTFSYNDNGLVTDLREVTELDPLAISHTRLTYENLGVDANDVAAKWKAGRTIPHLSQLKTRTTPKGTATASPADDFQWDFDYDARGNVTGVLDAENRASGKRTVYTYDGFGQVQSVTDPNDHQTQLLSYDLNGLPTAIKDARAVADGAAYVTRFGYDADGLLRWIQDANHFESPNVAGCDGADAASRGYRTCFDYDSFHRLGRQSAPKSTALRPGLLLWSNAEYDPNDNLIAEIGPHEAAANTKQGAKTTSRFDAMDRILAEVGPDRSVDLDGEETTFAYDAAGRVDLVTSPRGNGPGSTAGDDFSVRYGYDRLDRVVSQSRVSPAKTLREQYCYDVAGDLRSITRPKAGNADVTCTPYADRSFTTKLDYDDAHRVVKQTDPEGRVRSQTYDANGNVENVTDEQRLAEPERRSYNQRDELVRITEPFTDTRKLFTEYEYDPVGNLKREISQRSFDAGGTSSGEFVTTHHYDSNDQLIKTDLPDDGSGPTAAAYVHRAYDRIGNLTMVSLPVTKASASTLVPEDKTVMRHWDPGWIQETDHPTPSRATYEYTAEGWQSKRTAHRRDGTSRTTEWSYFLDGVLREKTGRDGRRSFYSYDENNNLLTADTDSGVDDASERPMHIESTWDGFDRQVKIRERKTGETDWRVTDYVLDDNGNLATRTDNRVETTSGTMVQRGRIHDFTYNLADELITQRDHGKDSAATATGDDREISSTYTPAGWLKSRTIKRLDSGSFVQRQRTEWTHFATGDVKTLETRNGQDAIKQSHTIGYLDGERYVNGHRVTDTFKLEGPDTAKRCRVASCVKTYTYDARDRVTMEALKREDGSTKTTGYDLTAASNLERITVNGQLQTRFGYQAAQLREQFDASGAVVRRFFYDASENMDCVTTAAGSRANCDAWPNSSTNLVERHEYDELDRLKLSRKWNPANASKKDESNYVYDALDRPVQETETHDSQHERKTDFTYIGLTDHVSRERKTSPDDASYKGVTKEFGYDSDGNRITLTREKDGNPQRDFSYGYDVYGNVSLLLDDAGSARAAYGYQAYGDPEPDVTAERDGDDPSTPTTDTEPLNPYRYSAKRLDTGNGTLDMGARRYGPSIAGFLQQDMFEDALGDLNLSQDPLTSSRYSLAGGNPVSFIETDGHMPAYNTPGAARKFSRARARAGGRSSSTSRETGPVTDANSTGGYDPRADYRAGRAANQRALNAQQEAARRSAARASCAAQIEGNVANCNHIGNDQTDEVRRLGTAAEVGSVFIPGPGWLSAPFRLYRAYKAYRAARAAKHVDIDGAKFAQKSFSERFSKEGDFKGRPIDDIAGELASGAKSPKDVPIDVIMRDGNTLILNTRSAQALKRAGIPRSSWHVRNRTGDQFYEDLLSGQLRRNRLDSSGTDLP